MAAVALLHRMEAAEAEAGTRGELATQALLNEARMELLRYETMFRQMPSAVTFHTLDGAIEYASPSIQQVLGYTPEEHRELHPNEVIVAEDVTLTQQIFGAVASGESESRTAYYRIRHKNGSLRWMEGIAIRAPGDRVVAYQHDVTELIETRQALAEATSEAATSQAWLRQIIDLLPVIVHVKDADGRFLMVNQMTASMIGKPVNEIEGKLLTEVYPDPSGHQSLESDRRAFATGERITAEQHFVSGDREMYLTRLTVPFRTLDGRLAALNVATDVTALKRIEQALRVSELRYRTQFELAPEAILTYDANAGRFIEANQHAERLLGRTRNELFQISPSVLSPDSDIDETEASLPERIQHAIDTSESIAFETSLMSLDRARVPCEIRIVRLPADTGRLLRISIVDVSERKRVESLRARSLELEMQNRRFREANRLKSEFLANMSHELRTPLNAIIGFAQLLHTGYVAPGSSQYQEFIGDILTSGRHLLQLINDVLDLSKIEAGKLVLHPEIVDPQRLLNEVIAVLRGLSAERRVRVEVDADPNLVEVTLDPSRFKQVLYNYLSNALKFTPEGGHIVVRTRIVNGSDHFQLEVEDSGVGIAAEDLPRLFQEFEQLEGRSSKRHPGTGLGLALTRRLVEAQGGAVGVTSTLGKGSRFFALLPIRAGAVPVVSRRAEPAAGRPTILMVEDEERDRQILIETLHGAGFAVSQAATGAEALRLASTTRFDAITLDLLLPDLSGLELLASLRSGGLNRDVPIIVVSVVASHRTVAGFAVHDVLHKPLDRGRLLESLAQAGLAGGRRGDILVVDDDPVSLRLMEATLSQLGRRAICRSDGKSGLEAALMLAPSAIILDLLMPEMDGFEFLARLRELPDHATTPVMVWTSKDLDVEELSRLRSAARGVLSKGLLSSERLLIELRSLLGDLGDGRKPGDGAE